MQIKQQARKTKQKSCLENSRFVQRLQGSLWQLRHRFLHRMLRPCVLDSTTFDFSLFQQNILRLSALFGRYAVTIAKSYNFHGHQTSQILDFGVPDHRKSLIFHFCRCRSKNFFVIQNWSLNDPRYAWKSSRRALFKSAIFFYEKSVKIILFCHSSSTFSEFSVLAT